MSKLFSLFNKYLYFIKGHVALFFFAGFLLPTPEVLLPTPHSRLTWARLDSLYQHLPSSVHVYRTTDSLDGRPNIAYYLEPNYPTGRYNILRRSVTVSGISLRNIFGSRTHRCLS
ncbi:MAG: hypothetical protein WKF97_03960 [Chitinophagaceae bacterium]